MEDNSSPLGTNVDMKANQPIDDSDPGFALVRFNISSTIPPGSTVLWAEFHITSGDDCTVNVHEMLVRHASLSFVEHMSCFVEHMCTAPVAR